jgi:hypothetical protein
LAPPAGATVRMIAVRCRLVDSGAAGLPAELVAAHLPMEDFGSLLCGDVGPLLGRKIARVIVCSESALLLVAPQR